MADAELAVKLAKRLAVADSTEEPEATVISQTSTNTAKPDPIIASGGNNVSVELQTKLDRRQVLNDAENPDSKNLVSPPARNYQTIYGQFPEFSRKQLKHYENMFKRYTLKLIDTSIFFAKFYCRFDENKDNFLCLAELKRMFETLGAPQTHLALKKLMTDVDEDRDNKINFREVNFYVLFWSIP